jgi:putative nucleotidyltransferase with HDIG domain
MTDSSSSALITDAPGRSPDELLKIFSAADDLPTLPQVAMQLLKLLDDADSNAGDVARLIQDDLAISVKVLKMVNSSLYASTATREISDLQFAVSRMGFVTVANIALSTSVFEAFKTADQPIFNRNEFWRHSVCVGILASLLHERLSPQVKTRFSRDTVHLAGIVHDIGKILFERYANAEFHQALIRAKAKNMDALIEERQQVGMGHDEAGAWLAQRWRLGKEVVSVVRYHHQPLCCPDEDHRELVMLIHIADWIAHKLKLGQSGQDFPELDRQVQKKLNVTPELIQSMREEIKIQTAQSQVLFSLNGQ